MSYLDLNQFRELELPNDIKSETIEEKLSSIAHVVPEKFRPEVDRCYQKGFERALKLGLKGKLRKKSTFSYFTETPQAPQFHDLARKFFMVAVTYGGNLGQLVAQQPHKKELVKEIQELSTRVFKYAQHDGPLPDFRRRPDLTLPANYANPDYN